MPVPALHFDAIRNRSEFDTPDWTRQLQNADAAWFETAAKGHWQVSFDRINKLREWMNRSIIGRDELIDLMLVATVAQLPMLMLGTWGTAKSMVVRKMTEGIGIQSSPIDIAREQEFLDAVRAGKELPDLERGRPQRRQQPVKSETAQTRRHFEYLVTRLTTPEEIVGVADIQLMLDRAVHMRQTKGLLPQAEIAFLDEIFKANSSILNALLAIINERVLHNAGRAWRVKLIMLFGASNEPPQDEDLGAFYDRFPVRYQVEPVAGDQLHSLLTAAHAGAFDSAFPDTETNRMMPNPEMPCVNDFRMLHGVSMVAFGGRNSSDGSKTGDRFRDRFTQLFQNLRIKYDLSDRSFGQYYRLARAHALLDGRPNLELQDARVLQYCGKGMRAASELRGVVDQFLGTEK